MNISANIEARPPYVTFERRGTEDRDESIRLGRYVEKDVDVAIVTPHGSKDRFENVVSDWFVRLKQQVQAERFPFIWLQAYQRSYEEWSSGQEISVTGTPIQNWAYLSKAQVASLVTLGIRVVEDVAAMNEESMARVGMGARGMKDKAIEYLEGHKISEGMQAINEELQLSLGAMKGELAEKDLRIDKLAAMGLDLANKLDDMQAKYDAMSKAYSEGRKTQHANGLPIK